MLVTPFIHLIYGILWLIWLNALRKPTSATVSLQTENTKCSAVKPYLSTFLYIIAWIQVVMSVIMIGFICASAYMRSQPITPYLILMLLILIGILVLQILYIRDIRNSERTLSDDCTTKQNRIYRYIIYGIAVFLIIIGILGIVGLVTSLSSPNPHEYTEKDIASLLHNPELTLMKSKPVKHPSHHKHKKYNK